VFTFVKEDKYYDMFRIRFYYGFIFKKCLGGWRLKEKDVFKLTLVSIPERCGIIGCTGTSPQLNKQYKKHIRNI